LVWEELGEVPSERVSTIKRVLWRYNVTLEQVNEALLILESQGKVEKVNPEWHLNKDDPVWRRCGRRYDEDDLWKLAYA